MAKKLIRIGSLGPFGYEDTNHEAVDTDGNVKANNFITEGLSTNVRLVVSNANQELEEVADLTSWIAGGSHITVTDDSDGSVTIETQNLIEINNIVGADSPYNISVSAYRSVVIVDATDNSVTVNLPPAANWSGQTVVIKKTDNVNTVTVQADGTEEIDGSNTQTLSGQYNAITLISDGTDIWIASTQ